MFLEVKIESYHLHTVELNSIQQCQVIKSVTGIPILAKWTQNKVIVLYHFKTKAMDPRGFQAR